MLCDDAGERFFGEGPCRLLHLIEETGSLRSAAAQMGLSYSKALRLVQHAEKELGFSLTCKTIGGRGGRKIAKVTIIDSTGRGPPIFRKV